MHAIGAPLTLNDTLNPSYLSGPARQFQDYIKEVPQKGQAFLMRVGAATHPIFSEGRYMGNCVALTPSCLLASSHCVSGQEALIRGKRCRVIFDGRSQSLDFKILQSERPEWMPASFSVSPAFGHSVALYFKNVRERLILHVKPFESEQTAFAARSDRASVATYPGESGAPRMTLQSGLVHSIHQGEQEGLKFCDIYEALRRSPYPEIQEMIKGINIPDVAMAAISMAPLQLREGAVAEEKTRVKGELQIEGTTFCYAEQGEGRGNRRIRIWQKGIDASSCDYTITPNPHNNAVYNNRGQVQFYAELAKKLAQKKLPHSLIVKSLGESYGLLKLD